MMRKEPLKQRPEKTITNIVKEVPEFQREHIKEDSISSYINKHLDEIPAYLLKDQAISPSAIADAVKRHYIDYSINTVQQTAPLNRSDKKINMQRYIKLSYFMQLEALWLVLRLKEDPPLLQEDFKNRIESVKAFISEKEVVPKPELKSFIERLENIFNSKKTQEKKPPLSQENPQKEPVKQSYWNRFWNWIMRLIYPKITNKKPTEPHIFNQHSDPKNQDLEGMIAIKKTTLKESRNLVAPEIKCRESLLSETRNSETRQSFG